MDEFVDFQEEGGGAFSCSYHNGVDPAVALSIVYCESFEGG